MVTIGTRMCLQSKRAAAKSFFGQSAYTLIELMIVLSIAGLLIGLAAPGIRSLLAQSRAGSAMMELHALLMLAKQTAIMRNSEITLCGVDANFKCVEPWNGNPTLVFEDSNHNKRLDSGEYTTAYSHLTRHGKIRWRASGGRDYLRYKPSGSVKEMGSFAYCEDHAGSGTFRGIVISMTGRSRTAADSDGDGIVEDGSGKPLLCQ